MSASRATVDRILDALVPRLAPVVLMEFVEDLERIGGNRSYRETVARLRVAAERRYNLMENPCRSEKQSLS